ncbi:hypothetical protein RYX36_037039 [Vicia faba]
MDFKVTVHPPTVSTLEPSQQEMTAIDFLCFLRPRSYNTKKRSKRRLIHHVLANNNTSPRDMFLEPVENLDANHREFKRMKLSINGNDIEMMSKPFVPLTSEGIDETMVKEEKNLNEESMLKSNLEVDRSIDGIEDICFTSKKSILHVFVTEDSLKKLDSFNRWMGKEIEDVKESSKQCTSNVLLGYDRK